MDRITVLKSFCAVWLCSLSTLHAAHAAAIDDFRKFVDSASAISGQFVQTTQNTQAAGSPRGKQTSGQFVIARPGKFRWSIEKPYEQLIVSDGAKVSLYDKDLNQVTVRQLKDALSATPAALLLGGELLGQFTLKDAGNRDGLEWLEATPKAKDMQFTKISVGMAQGSPTRMELQDNFGQTTRIDFKAINNKAQAAADGFVFTPPKGADVLTQ
jgi:outer membrane lipoprotein carrier protein